MIVIILAILAMVSGTEIPGEVLCEEGKTVNGNWSAGGINPKPCAANQLCVRQVVGAHYEQACGACSTDTNDACCKVNLPVDGEEQSVKQFCSTEGHKSPPTEQTFTSCKTDCNIIMSKAQMSCPTIA